MSNEDIMKEEWSDSLASMEDKMISKKPKKRGRPSLSVVTEKELEEIREYFEKKNQKK